MRSCLFQEFPGLFAGPVHCPGLNRVSYREPRVMGERFGQPPIDKQAPQQHLQVGLSTTRGQRLPSQGTGLLNRRFRRAYGPALSSAPPTNSATSVRPKARAARPCPVLKNSRKRLSWYFIVVPSAELFRGHRR
jgi:hypothetical protein